uniref:Calretinin n=1 Tax=Salvator merianae TaxID=96440 RepID=A0A8D0B4X0_SALMN
MPPLQSRALALLRDFLRTSRAPSGGPGRPLQTRRLYKGAERRQNEQRPVLKGTRAILSTPRPQARSPMAGQQPPYLHLAELTASQFLDIWKHYDADGNGYIEGKELENFFRELESARKGAGMESRSVNFAEKMQEFMQKYDKNADGRIEMSEVSSATRRSPCQGPVGPLWARAGPTLLTSSAGLRASGWGTLLHAKHTALCTCSSTPRAGAGKWGGGCEANSGIGLFNRLLCLESFCPGVSMVFSPSPPKLAQILPTEENFLLCFRTHVSSSAEFMETWRKYDTDRSGYIEANELKGFLSDLLEKASRPYDESKLQEYTQTILRMFDLNGDGKLCLSEMSRLLPVQENFLLKFQGMKLDSDEFNAIFAFYDKDGNGYIDENELDALLKDLYEKNKKEMSIQHLTSYRESVMNLSDGGKLHRKELEIVLCSEPPL